MGATREPQRGVAPVTGEIEISTIAVTEQRAKISPRSRPESQASCLTQAYLIFRSTFFPRVIGGLLAIQGSLYLTNSFAHFVSPAAGDRVFPFLALSGIAEISFCLWLLFVGVNVQRWREQAGLLVPGQVA
jgi:hypothetical protein